MGSIIDIKTEGFRYIAANLGNACNDLDEAVAQIVSVESGLNMRVQAKENIISGLNALRSNVHMQRDRVNMIKDQINSALLEYIETDTKLGSKARGICSSITNPISVDAANLIRHMSLEDYNKVMKLLKMFGLGNMAELLKRIWDITHPLDISESSNNVPTSTSNVDLNAIEVYNYDQELKDIKNQMKYGTVGWNHRPGDPEYPINSLSCVWFSKEKLRRRGFSDEDIINGLNNYNSFDEWKKTEEYRLFSNTFPNPKGHYHQMVSAYLEYMINKNGGKPLYNIYVAGENWGHSMLIDKAYIDEKGVLQLQYSNNRSYNNIEIDYNSNGNTYKGYDIEGQQTRNQGRFDNLDNYNKDTNEPYNIYIFGNNKK